MTDKQLSAAITRNQARAVDLLKWNAEKYNQNIYDRGLEFLNAYIGDDPEAVSILEKREAFWNWWKMSWNAREEAFIIEWDGLEDSIQLNDLTAIYRDLHNPKVLACEIHPPAEVYGDDFVKIKMAAQ